MNSKKNCQAPERRLGVWDAGALGPLVSWIKTLNRSKFWVLFLAVTLFGCDAIYGMLQKEGAEEKEMLGDIVPMESNPRVKDVQKLLKLYGYAIGFPDGIMGGNTRKAIEKFQTDNKLKPSRFVDFATWDMLHVFDGYGLVQDGELQFAQIQKALDAAGFHPGPPDGKFGRKTQDAVMAFQKDAGLKADGKIGFKTLWALAEHLPEPTKN